MAIKFSSGEEYVVIETIEHAKELLVNICFLRQYDNHTEMKQCEQLTEICNHFSLDTDNIIIYNNPDLFEVSGQFPNFYQMKPE